MTHKPTDSLIERIGKVELLLEQLGKIANRNSQDFTVPIYHAIQTLTDCKTTLELNLETIANLSHEVNTRLSSPVIEGELEKDYQQAYRRILEVVDYLDGQGRYRDAQLLDEASETLKTLHDENDRLRKEMKC